jgi:pantothenate kinase
MSRLPLELAARIDALLDTRHRVILGITGLPGSGKTTVAEAVVAYVGSSAVHVPMDGFHLADVELARLGRLQRKGAIDTFDGHSYLVLLERLRAVPPHIVYAPAFGREIEQPVAGSIPVFPDTRLVVTEGNYLLDDEQPWPQVRKALSQVWYLDAPADVRRRRLISRHEQFGKSHEQARVWVQSVDEPNARRIEKFRHKADLTVTP